MNLYEEMKSNLNESADLDTIVKNAEGALSYLLKLDKELDPENKISEDGDNAGQSILNLINEAKSLQLTLNHYKTLINNFTNDLQKIR